MSIRVNIGESMPGEDPRESVRLYHVGLTFTGADPLMGVLMAHDATREAIEAAEAATTQPDRHPAQASSTRLVLVAVPADEAERSAWTSTPGEQAALVARLQAKAAGRSR